MQFQDLKPGDKFRSAIPSEIQRYWIKKDYDVLTRTNAQSTDNFKISTFFLDNADVIKINPDRTEEQ